MQNQTEPKITRVLVVDDDEVDFRYAKRSLTGGTGPTVELDWEPDPTRVLDRLDREHHDAVMLDFQMESLDGLDVLRSLRQARIHTPVIMLTAHDSLELDEAARAAGADDYLVKGQFTASDLRRSLRYAISRERSRREMRLLKSAVDQGPDGTAITASVEAGHNLVYANPVFECLTGHFSGDLIGRPVSILFGPESDESQIEVFEQCLRELRPFSDEMILYRADGSKFHAYLEVTAVGDHRDGGPHHVVVLRDISEQRRQEERIREQARMLDLAEEAIVAQDLEGRVIFWNEGAAQLFGIPRHQALGRHLPDLLKFDRDPFNTARRDTFNVGSWRGEMQASRPEADPVMLQSTWTLLRNEKDAPTSILTINRDITEERELRDQALRSQRMEAIGSLAAGVAHDLNNILAPIIMGASLFDLEENVPASLLELRNTIETNANRGAQIVRQLLSFARGTSEDKTVVQIRHLAKEVLTLARETFPPSIKIQLDLPTDLWPVIGNASQFHQILLNLAVNARDAMPDGGVLKISAANLALDEDAAERIPGAHAGEFTTFSVSDTGTGIPEAVREKMFDLFYTTKPEGYGTGLGLATVKGIVEQYGGFLELDTKLGVGTTFRIGIPASIGNFASQTTVTQMPAGAGELVLFVDDEQHIRSIVRKALIAHGYEVVCAENGIEGLQVFTERTDEIAVVVSDVLMPDSDGPTMVKAMRRIKPDLRVLFCSGATSRNSVETEPSWRAELPEVRLLEKPYKIQRLLAALRETLDEPPVTAPVSA